MFVCICVLAVFLMSLVQQAAVVLIHSADPASLSRLSSLCVMKAHEVSVTLGVCTVQLILLMELKCSMIDLWLRRYLNQNLPRDLQVCPCCPPGGVMRPDNTETNRNHFGASP